ncbi:hypothetical protein QBC38DRAFT_495624 [Podospora fimiseda]|uniref:DUF6594 domain-containing protein n=1 Tax=Podospora fimiseda TaxID=252190 RepID=A0AAN7BXT5_9PEZI|nr:hypothetical protein QBC38DRAFT_495624 [Podospora fimiseda]
MSFRYRRRRANEDEETPQSSKQIGVDFDDDRWIIDVDLHNIITKIARPRSRLKQLKDLLRSAETPTDALQGEQSYLINFAVLQRIYIGQLREKLIRQAIDLRFKARQPAGWTDTLKLYSKSKAQALKDYDYMEQRHLLPDDPFYVSGERYNDRKLLQHLLGIRGEQIKRKVVSKEIWEETSAYSSSAARHNTRPDNYRRSWIRGFWERIGVAIVSGAFLIAPMWLMVLRNTLYTGLISTTGFVTVFGLTTAAFLRSPTEVMSCTAAYAAVLVVFVGLITETAKD